MGNPAVCMATAQSPEDKCGIEISDDWEKFERKWL